MNPVWTVLRKKMLQYPDARFSGETKDLSFEQLIKMVESIASQIRTILSPRTKAAVYCEHEENAAVSILACFCADVVPVPMSRRYGDAHCEHILTLTEPDLLLTDMETALFGHIPHYDVQSGKRVEGRPCHKPDASLSDVALLMCTSGTTGTPKAAMITFHGLLCNLDDIAAYFHIGLKDRILIARPLYHCAVLTGELLTALYQGASIRFTPNGYNPPALLTYITEHQMTVLCGTPTMLYHLCLLTQRAGITLPLKTVALSGECNTPEAAALLRACCPVAAIYHVYGMTEASPRISYLPPDLFDEHPLSAGIPLRSVQIRVVDADGQVLPTGIDGFLQLQGPNVMKGYYRNEALTREKFAGDWLRTGDIAAIDSNGLLILKGRADDMIIKAGMNIYPAEIENALLQNPGIRQVMAYRLYKNGRQVIGLDIVPESTTLTEADIRRICEDCLPRYQLPDAIRLVDELPRNASGKIMRPRS